MVESYLKSLGLNSNFTKTTVSQNNVNQQPVQKPVNQTVKTQQPAQTTKPVQTQPAAPSPTQTTSALSAYEQKVVDLTNQERAKNGLTALKVDGTYSVRWHTKNHGICQLTATSATPARHMAHHLI